MSVYDVLVDGCMNEDPLSYQANHHITISGSAAYQLKCTSNNASQTSQTKGRSMEVRWVSVVPGARTSVAKVWTSTQPCWPASTRSSKDARTFSSTEWRQSLLTEKYFKMEST